MQREIVERTAAVFKLGARLNEEHRFTETAVSAETKAWKDNAAPLVLAFRRRIGEEARKTIMSVGKLVGQIMALFENVAKSFGQFTAWQGLHLWGNQLAAWPESFGQLTVLWKLHREKTS